MSGEGSPGILSLSQVDALLPYAGENTAGVMPVHPPNVEAPEGCPMQGGSDFEKLTALSHLLWCWGKARKAKARKARVQRFDRDALRYLSMIQQRLRTGNFEFGPYRYFQVIEKKRRDVVDSPMKDRVVHWVVYDHLTTIWQKRFIHDSYGNIRGRGTHAAVRRTAEFARKPANKYVLSIDLSKFFFSVQHSHLKRAVLRHLGDQKMRDLVVRLIDSFNTDSRYDDIFPESSTYRQERPNGMGMPLGNLTSQLFCNILLNDFDHWVKEKLGVRYYIRYVDDMLFFGESKTELRALSVTLIEYLDSIGLIVNPRKMSILPISHGVPFLGYIIWANHISAGWRIRKGYAAAMRTTHLIQNAKVQAYRTCFRSTGASR
jgi:RNA-directed DNA polymerase